MRYRRYLFQPGRYLALIFLEDEHGNKLQVPINDKAHDVTGFKDGNLFGHVDGSYTTFSYKILLDTMAPDELNANVSQSFATTIGKLVTEKDASWLSGTGFVTGDNITATVDLSLDKGEEHWGTYQSTDESDEFCNVKTRNSLFGKNDHDGTIEVGYVRHLANMNNYGTGGSPYGDESSDDNKDRGKTFTVKLNRSDDENFSYISFEPTISYSEDGGITTITERLWEDDALYDSSNFSNLLPNEVFQPITNSVFVSKIVAFDGQGNSLKFFKIGNGTDNTGLFGSVGSVEFTALVV
ncbi:MAG: hypothetical protein J6Z00_03555, partial [Clostridia bacterium]|nr:hypothetical protein [Clostridia bacterium]